MKKTFHLLQLMIPAIVLALGCSVATATTDSVTIHKTDDSVVTGTIASVETGKLMMAGKPWPKAIAFDDIMQVVFRETPAPQAAPVAVTASDATDNRTSGVTVVGALLGGRRVRRAVPMRMASVAGNNVATTKPTTAIAASTSQPVAKAKPAQITLTDGDVIHASVKGWGDQKLSLQLANGQPLQLPASAITEMWFASADLQAKAKALAVDPGPEDVAFVQKDSDVVAVKGLVLGIDGDSLQFRYDDKDRKIGMTKLVGLLLRGNSPLPLTGFHQLVRIDSGDQFSGNWTGVDDKSVTITTPQGVVIAIPRSTIFSIDFINGRVTYLSDLKPMKVEQTPYFGRLIPYQMNHSLSGGPLVMSDGTYTKGIAVHSRCVLSYDVSAGFDRFKTKLGFEQPMGIQGRVLARVVCDGKPAYDNPDARGDQPPVDIDVPLTGVHTLTLEIDFGQDQDVGDRVIWANARLIRAKATE